MRTIAIAIVLTSAGVAHAGPGDRDTVLSVVGGYQAAGDPHGSVGELEHSPVFGLSLRWDRSPGDDDLVAFERRERGDLAPELSLLGDGRDVMVLAGLRLEIEAQQDPRGRWGNPKRLGAWIAPRVGLSTAADSLVLGGDIGVTVYRQSGWSGGFYAGAYLWRGEAALPCACLAFDPTGEDSAGPQVLQGQLGLIIGSPL